MPGKNPADVAAKWVQRTGAATDAYKAGVERVQTSPGALAARASDTWVRNVTAAKAKFAANSAAVDLGAWKKAASEKGASRLAEGVTMAAPKMQAFMAQLLPHADAVSARVRAMPKGGPGNYEASIARARAAITGMAEFKYRKGQ